jgi:hypothetical protein
MPDISRREAICGAAAVLAVAPVAPVAELAVDITKATWPGWHTVDLGRGPYPTLSSPEMSRIMEFVMGHDVTGLPYGRDDASPV